MKEDIKKQLIEKLKLIGEERIPRAEFPIKNLLLEILEKNDPNLELGDWDNSEAREKGEMRSESWSLFLSLTGMSRIDFYLDINGKEAGIVTRNKSDGKGGFNEVTEIVIYKPWKGYKYPTISSVLKDYKYSHNGKIPTGSEMANFIINYYIID